MNFHEAPYSADGKGFQGIRLRGECMGQLGRAGAHAPGIHSLPAANQLAQTSPQHWPSPTANSTELDEPTSVLSKEILPCTWGRWLQGCPGCTLALSTLRWPPRHSPSASTVGTYASFCFLLSAQPSQVFPGCGAGGSVLLTPLASPGRVVLPALLSGRGPWGWECWAVPGAWMCAGSGSGWLGLFSSLFAQPWGQPAMWIKAGIPWAANCRPARRGGRGAASLDFPNCRVGHHASTAWPEIIPGSAHPSARLGDAGRDLGVPTWHPVLTSCPLVEAAAPCLPPLQELRDLSAGGHGSLGPEHQYVLLCFSC